MQIELTIDGKKKIFTAPYVPALANRKWVEVQAAAEERTEKPTSKELLEESDAIMSILADIVFKGQFTVEDLYNGASQKYIDEKLAEAIFGVKKEKEDDEGNKEGK